jgi:hypothetical protein
MAAAATRMMGTAPVQTPGSAVIFGSGGDLGGSGGDSSGF